jgi:hypothetical protein
MWLENPKQQLRSEDALSRLTPPWDSDKVRTLYRYRTVTYESIIIFDPVMSD